MTTLPYSTSQAVSVLSKADTRLAKLIRRVGPYALETRDMLSPFQTLLQSIVYQQLTGTAAGAIHRRVLALFPGRRRASARGLLALYDLVLREAGLSRAKIAAARDLASKVVDRTLPSRRRLDEMHDEEIIESLVGIRGIGRWSVEMLLLFNLARPDVLPVTDLGIRKGFLLSHGGDALPEPKELRAFGERWRPYRSVASWYLWRANDL